MGKWQPFRIDIHLAAPISLNHPWLHLDGVLAHLLYQRVLGRDYYVLPTKAVQHLDMRRMGPFAHMIQRSGVLSCASVSLFAQEKLGSLQYFKRFEAEKFPGRKVHMGSGAFRAWMLRTVYVSTPAVMFYGCGKIDLVRELLSDLTHIGNDTRIGWGAIRNSAVTEIEEDRSIVCEGRAMRPIPTRFLTRWSDAVNLAWKPPYWAAENVELCAPPGAEVELP